LAAIPKTFSLFSTFSDLSLFDLPDRFCQPYGDVHRIDHWAIGNRTPSRIPDRTIHSRRRAEGAPEKSRDADDGRSPDCDFDYCADAAVGGSGEPLRVDGGAFDCDFCGNRFCRRLYQGYPQKKSWIDGTDEVRLAGTDECIDRGGTDRDAEPWLVFDKVGGAVYQAVPS